MPNKYRPSNSSDGAIFQAEFCDRCSRQTMNGDGGRNCDILLRAISFKINDPEYPDQWTYDSTGRPTCTAYLADEPEQYRCDKTEDMFS